MKTLRVDFLDHKRITRSKFGGLCLVILEATIRLIEAVVEDENILKLQKYL